MDMSQRAWQPGLALKHHMQFPGSCCQLYLQNQAEEVSPGTDLLPVFGNYSEAPLSAVRL